MRTAAQLLGNERYYADAVFHEERRRVFGRCWIVVPGEADDGSRRVERCGSLVFAAGDPQPLTLAEALDPYAEWLAAATGRLSAPDHAGRVEVACNWKLLVENTLDDCHGGTLHAASLQQSFPDWRHAARIGRFGANSEVVHRLGAADLAFWRRLDRRLPLARYGSGEDYRHVFIFPNLYVSTFYDALVVVHRIEPIAADRSALDWRLFLPLSEPAGTAKAAILRAVTSELAAQAVKVIEEDLSIAVRAQRGRRFAFHPGLLGERELRTLDFQKRLLELVG